MATVLTTGYKKRKYSHGKKDKRQYQTTRDNTRQLLPPSFLDQKEALLLGRDSLPLEMSEVAQNSEVVQTTKLTLSQLEPGHHHVVK